MTVLAVFDGFGGSAKHLALLLLLLENAVARGSRDGFDGLAVSAVVAVSVVTATPLKLNPPPFSVVLTKSVRISRLTR